jgi:hypothetical protein
MAFVVVGCQTASLEDAAPIAARTTTAPASVSGAGAEPLAEAMVADPAPATRRNPGFASVIPIEERAVIEDKEFVAKFRAGTESCKYANVGLRATCYRSRNDGIAARTCIDARCACAIRGAAYTAPRPGGQSRKRSPAANRELNLAFGSDWPQTDASNVPHRNMKRGIPWKNFTKSADCRLTCSNRSTGSRRQRGQGAPISSIWEWAIRICRRRKASLTNCARRCKDPRTHRYSTSRGIPGLRRAQAAYYQRRFGVKLDPETQVVATLGSKEGFANMAQAITAPGDVILCPNPTYPIHAFGFIMSGGVIRSLDVVPDDSFFPPLERSVKTFHTEAAGADPQLPVQSDELCGDA